MFSYFSLSFIVCSVLEREGQFATTLYVLFGQPCR